MTEWTPTADIETLRRRAMLMTAIRQFFADRQVLEVDTPVLSSVGVTDVHVHNLRTLDGGFLLTSPEYPMKRLLAAGLGDCYQLGHVFRADESGARHNREFTLLEWYRLGWDHHQLMQEVTALCDWVHRAAGGSSALASTFLSYQAAFEGAGLPDPHRVSLRELRQVAALQLSADTAKWDRDACLDALMALVVEPGLPLERLTFVTDYPVSQAALARTHTRGGVELGYRFELYWQGMELANGYWELTDPKEQRRRFEQDAQRRVSQGLAVPEVDERLLAAMQAGMPECAGVALGVDRLLMAVLGKSHIREVLPFDADRA
ncbi:EF-P lysine aminoacylase EpmA [Saccharospirillum impatiens]|uniref:EF-P lysine aminoacylase EpmA n=1 Tax=Saccharospirillum impatiens TaxID=169438 RepID=UPI000407F1C9|nr:EF-P lysine aminoacylase EpmA [Saccharospirillum impatiens]